MRRILIVLFTLMLTFSLTACHRHSWTDADCISPKTCIDCNATEGGSLGHDWKEATCTTPKTCATCSLTEGKALGHNWKRATCTTLKTCSICGKTEGTVISHNWSPATCTAPQTCSACGKTEGTVTSHNWNPATCTAPQTCSACGKTEGTVTSHNWNPVTCTTPQTCSACGVTEGVAMGHDWEVVNVYTKKCKICSTKEIDQSKAPKNLGSLTPCTGKNYYKEDYNKQDIYGNKFSEGLYIRLYSGYTYSTEYVLNGEYKKFTTTFMVSSDSHEWFKGRFKIYVDDVLAYDSDMINLKTQQNNIEIDISGAMFIKFVGVGSSPNFESGYVMLSNPTLHH